MIHNLSDKEALEVIKSGKAAWDIDELNHDHYLLEQIVKKLERLKSLGWIEYTQIDTHSRNEGRRVVKVVVTLVKSAHC
jgi:hypothetical protein